MRDAWGWRPMIASARHCLRLCVCLHVLPAQKPALGGRKRGLVSAVEQLGRVRTSRKPSSVKFSEIHERHVLGMDEDERGWKGLMLPLGARPALIAALGIAFFTQAGGLEMMIYYTPTFLSDAGFNSSCSSADQPWRCHGLSGHDPAGLPVCGPYSAAAVWC
jgi:hypothetical protein